MTMMMPLSTGQNSTDIWPLANEVNENGPRPNTTINYSSGPLGLCNTSGSLTSTGNNSVADVNSCANQSTIRYETNIMKLSPKSFGSTSIQPAPRCGTTTMTMIRTAPIVQRRLMEWNDQDHCDVRCTGCYQAIRDQFYCRMADQFWHQACLRCFTCGILLSERCYFREGQLFCRDDFIK